jgi:hypothetical protein
VLTHAFFMPRWRVNMSVILANVIFPAPTAAYVASVFFPIAAVLALTTEFAVYCWFQRGVLSSWRLLGVVIVVNLFSWIVGIALSLLLPSGLVPKLVDAGEPVYILTQGSHWSTIAVASFVWACFLSFGLEYGGLWVLRTRLPFQRLALCAGVANAASYCVIAAVVAVQLYFDLF